MIFGLRNYYYEKKEKHSLKDQYLNNYENKNAL
jgi:hypothetical protein